MAMRPAWVDQELFPFESRFLEVDGARVHYVDEGQGPVFFGLHGNPTWSFLYRHIIDGLKDQFRCLALDYPGFGLSTAPPGYRYTVAEHAKVVEGFVTQLGLDGITLMGQDWGGPIGMTVALERADRVAGMVFANTWYWPAQGSLATFSVVMSSPPAQWLILQRNAFVNFIMPRSVSTPMEPAVFKTYQDAQPSPEARRGVAEFPRQIRAARPLLEKLASNAPKALAGKPLELVWAMKDPAFGNPAVIARWQRDFPDAHVTQIATANHYIQEDAPEALADAVRRVSARA